MRSDKRGGARPGAGRKPGDTALAMVESATTGGDAPTSAAIVALPGVRKKEQERRLHDGM